MRAVEFDNSKENFVEMFSTFLPIDRLPKFIFEKEIKSDDQPTFGKYENGVHQLHVALQHRHPNDILRTIAHELVHFKQDLNNQLNSDSGETGSPEENEANATAGVIMRHFNLRHPEFLGSTPINI